MMLAEKQSLCGKPVSLNGTPAVISGAKGPFAHVRSLTKPYSGEWTWEAVRRIVADGGDFRL